MNLNASIADLSEGHFCVAQSLILEALPPVEFFHKYGSFKEGEVKEAAKGSLCRIPHLEESDNSE